MPEFLSLNTYQKVTYILLNVQLIEAIIGIIGNIFVFIVFSRPNLKKHSYSFYCRVMAITDIGVFLYCFRNWAAYFLDANLDVVSPFFCSISLFVLYTLGGVSFVMLTLIAADRMVTIVYPNRFAFIKKTWFQWLLVSIAIVLNASLNISPVIYNHIVEINLGINSSVKICVLDTQIALKQTYCNTAIFIFFNIIINNILNIKIVACMVSSRRKVARNFVQPNQNRSSKDRKFATISVGLNISCMITKLPLIIAFFVNTYVSITFDQLMAMQATVLTIALIDNGLQFFINFFFNSVFHDEFLLVIGFRKRNMISAASSVATITSANLKNKDNQFFVKSEKFNKY